MRNKGLNIINLRYLILLFLSIFLYDSTAFAQLNENCTVSILNRTSRVKEDGTWGITNVPSNFGEVRARATCVEEGQTLSGQSDLISIPTDGDIEIPTITLGNEVPIPESLTITSTVDVLTQAGETAQLTITANYPDSSTGDVTASSAGTSYTISNTDIATISSDGEVTAVSSGLVIISALNEGTLGLIQLEVQFGVADTDGDGIPDDLELANGLDPNNPADGAEDPDGDGLTNKEELVDFGTDINNPDTDGDGIEDGEEVVAGTDGFITSPVLADTDGDGFNDSAEIGVGTDPTDSSSFIDLATDLQSIEVFPSDFNLVFNVVFPESSIQLQVTGTLTNNVTIDLTSTGFGTTYDTSDTNICNFSGESGRVFAGADGTCTVTVGNNDFTDTATINVTTFLPQPVSFISIPGYANNVDVVGNIAFVAAGANGLHVVSVSDKNSPSIIGSFNTSGNANDVKVINNIAYIADGASGLQIVDVSIPSSPQLLGTLNTSADARDVVVSGGLAFIADGADGLKIIDVSDPANPALLGSVDTPGSGHGVDVNNSLTVAAVADGTSGLQVVDITNPASPAIVGSAVTTDARDVRIKDNFAYVADFTDSFVAVDITIPSSPQVTGSTPRENGGLLVDIEILDELAFVADIFFVNALPIIGLEVPENPVARTFIDFSNFRDDNATGVDVEGDFAYITASTTVTQNGTTGNTRLYIGQYIQFSSTDSDNDGLPDQAELSLGTDPLDPDTDNDGMLDGFEADNGFNPFDPSDAAEDADSDGLTNLEEQTNSTDPNNPDSDNDGLTDGDELNTFSTDPLNDDSDGDFLTDGDEVNVHQTDPNDVDTDGDGLQDAVEVNQGCNPAGADIATVFGVIHDEFGDPVRSTEVTFSSESFTTEDNGLFSITAQLSCPVERIQVIAVKDFGAVERRGATGFFKPDVSQDNDVGVIVIRDVQSDTLFSSRKFLPRRASFDITTSDFNLDGINDVATTFLGPVVMLGNGDGTFGQSIIENFWENINTSEVEAGFFNDDDIPDLLVGTTSSPFALLLIGNGDGTFQDITFHSTGGPQNSISIGDVNLDGVDDFVATHGSLGTASIMFGNGDGTFQVPIVVSTDEFTDSAAISDMNLDGLPEIIVTGSITKIFQAGGENGFEFLKTISGINSNDVDVGDFNGDGLPDIILASGHIYKQEADGSFIREVDFTGANRIDTFDLNRDGRTDFVVLNSVQRAGVYLSTFDANDEFAFTRRNIYAGTDLIVPEFVDVDIDGDKDIVVLNKNDSASFDFESQITILTNKGLGQIDTASFFQIGQNAVDMEMGFVNQDSSIDVVTANSSSSDISVLLGNGDGTFQSQRRFPTLSGPRFLELTDFNSDGINDVAVSGLRKNSISVLSGNGAGDFVSRVDIPTTEPVFEMETGDYNGDSQTDIAYISNETTDIKLYLLFGDGSGGFISSEPTVISNIGLSLREFILESADLNQDGNDDLFVNIKSPAHRFTLLGNGDGTFTQRGVQVNNLASIRDMSFVDVNFDLILDRIGRGFNPPISFGVGDGTFIGINKSIGFNTGDFANLIRAGDLDGDCINDMVLSVPSSDDISVFLGTDFFSFDPISLYVQPGLIVPDFEIEDVNSDGGLDLVLLSDIPNTSDTFISVLLNKKPSNATCGIFEEVCDDGIDNDHDTIIDCNDGNCFDSPICLDDDNDGLSNAQEANLGTDPNNPDTDNDGLIDGDEITESTNPLNPDTDGDGITDGFEVEKFYLDPLDPSDAVLDRDNDGLSNLDEFLIDTDPNDTDSDDDNLSDADEVLVHNTDPLNFDTDGDGIFDGVEVSSGCDPLNPGNEMTTVGGRTVDAQGNPISAQVNIVESSVTSGSDGLFSIELDFVCIDEIQVTATANIDGEILKGQSAPTAPIFNGTTDVGDITLFAIDSFLVYPAASFSSTEIIADITSADMNNDGIVDVITANSEFGELLVYHGIGNGDFETPIAIDEPDLFPISLEIADMNDDNILDIIAVNGSSGITNLYIFLGDNNNEYQNRVLLTSQVGPENPSNDVIAYDNLTIGDLDNNGLVDVVVGGDFGLGIFYNEGNNVYSTEQLITVDAGDGGNDGLISPTITDLNNDGINDIIAGNYFDFDSNFDSDFITVLMGQGNRSYSAPDFIAVGVNTSHIATTDLNSDNVLDIVVAHGQGFQDFTASNDLSILIGNGDGTFQSAISIPVGIHDNNISFNSLPSKVNIADLNQDSNPDLVVTTQGDDFQIGYGRVSVFLGDGLGSFGPEEQYYAGFIPTSGTVSDFNNDGIPDVAVGNNSDDSFRDGPSDFVILFGRSDGTLESEVPKIINTFPDFEPFIESIDSGDITGDGLTDIVGVNFFPGNVLIFESLGNGQYDQNNTIALNIRPENIQLADLDLDGNLDIVTTEFGSVNGTISLVFNNGNGNFDLPVDSQVNPLGVILADMNKDGLEDIVFESANGIEMLLNQGSKTFSAPINIDPGPGSGTIQIEDIDSDGNLDIIAISTDILIHYGNGDGTFQPFVNSGIPNVFYINVRSNPLAIEDFDNDGNMDLAGIDCCGTALVLQTSPGQFEQPIFNEYVDDVGIGTFSFDGLFTIGKEDFNNDLNQDIIVSTMNKGKVIILFGQGDGTFPDKQGFSIGAAFPSSLHIDDLNGDGLPDIANTNFFTGEISILLHK